jgi:hypothetical protein
LKLNSVHRHDRYPASVDDDHSTGRQAHQMSLADACC